MSSSLDLAQQRKQYIAVLASVCHQVQQRTWKDHERMQKQIILAVCPLVAQINIYDMHLQDNFENMTNIIATINTLLNFIPGVRQRVNEAYESADWKGRDVFAAFSLHQYEFFRVVGETVTSFLEMMSLVIEDLPRLPSKLDAKNKLLMCLLWLKSYSTYSELALIFDVSQTDVTRVLNGTWQILYRVFKRNLQWPTAEEWTGMMNNWPTLPGVVGCIDATSHEILTPVDDKRTYYSGHRRYQCIHTQVIIDNDKNIRFVQSGFVGHDNDARTYRQMPTMGADGAQLHVPDDCWILADGIYPSEKPLLKKYRRNQLNVLDPVESAIRHMYNEEFNSHRVYIEHVIGKIKLFRVIGSLYRHDRGVMHQIVELCCSLAQRRVDIFDEL